MHLLQMAKIEYGVYRLYCSCGLWFTLPVRQDTGAWTDAQNDFFEHLADLEDDEPA